MPSPELRARVQALLDNPGVSEGAKARARQRLAQIDAAGDAAPAPRDLGGGYTMSLGEAQIGGGGPPAPGGSPFDRLAPKAPVRTGNPEAESPTPSPSASRADQVLGYLRSGLHGMDRAVTGGLGTRLGDWVDPGTKERGETAAREYPVGEVLGMIGGALSPMGLAGRAGQLGNAAAQGAIKGAGALAKIGRGALGGAVAGAAQEAGESVLGDRSADLGGAALAGGVMGGALSGVGAAATGIKNAIRDPAEQMGRDIASAERIGGRTTLLRGMAKGPTYSAAENEARALTAAGEPISPAGVAARKAVPKLGQAVQGDIDARLGAMSADNAAAGDQMVSLQPVVSRAVKRLQGMVRDQKALPGMTTRDLAQTIRQSANVRVVDWADDTLNQVDPANIVEGGFAKAVGLVRGEGDMSGKFVVLEPRSVSPQELESIRRTFDATGKVTPTSRRVVGESANAREMANAAREAREQLGPDALARAKRHEQSIGEMENTIHVAGLPAGTRKVSLSDQATREQLARGVGRYRARPDDGSGADRVMDQLAAGDDGLRRALDEASGVAATQRLRREGAVPLSPGGVGNYGFKDAAALRADALMRYLEGASGLTARPVGRGLIPAASTTRRDR